MKRMKSKDQFINIIGTWDGSDDGDVIDYLKSNDYTFKIQRGTKSVSWGDEELDKAENKRVRLIVLGEGLYEQWSLEENAILVITDEGDLNIWDTKSLEAHFEDVA